MPRYKVLDSLRNEEIEIVLPEPVPMVTPEGATIMFVSLVVAGTSAIMVPAVPVVAVIGGLTGAFHVGAATLAGGVLLTEGILGSLVCLGVKTHRLVFGMELEYRRRLIEKRNAGM